MMILGYRKNRKEKILEPSQCILKNNSGFSLIELIIGIMVMGIAFVGAMYALSELRSKSYQTESILRSTTMANSIMEIIRAHRYDEHITGSWSPVLGPEESPGDSYDDVDDYAGYLWSFPGYLGYQGRSRVHYVNPAVSWLDSTNIVTDYKVIKVTITYDGLNQPLRLASLITPFGYTESTSGGLGSPPPPP